MKILIIRFSSIGDIVLTSPIIRCIKNQIIESEIHFLTKDSFAGLLAHHPYIQKIHSLKKNDLSAIIESLKTENFDCIIDLHKNIRTFKIKRALHIKSYSFAKLNIQKWLFVNFKIDLLPEKHIIDRYFEGIQSLGITNDQNGIDFYLPHNFTYDLKIHALHKHNFYVVALGATYYTKQIPIDTLNALFKQLNDAPIVLIGHGEVDYNKSISIMENPKNKTMINLCNKLTIHESASLIQQSKLLLTGDTGMMHIASSFDVPIVTLWGNTHPKFGMYAYRNYGIKNYIVDLPCHPCSKLGNNACPRQHFHCMKKQDIDKIIAELPIN